MEPLGRLVLPTGLWREGVHHREASLRPLTGLDEDGLIESQEAGRPEIATMLDLLARCCVRLGGLAPVTPELLAELPVGDREALALGLRRLNLGERMAVVVRCPAEPCGELLELDLRASELLLPPYAEPRPNFAAAIGPAGPTLPARLPTTTDQLAAAEAVQRGEDAARILLRRCISDAPEGLELPAAELARLERALAERDPQAEIELELRCPACAQVFAAILDATRFVLRELRAGAALLYHEVAGLARALGWSEAEILTMPTRRRRRYVALLAQRETA